MFCGELRIEFRANLCSTFEVTHGESSSVFSTIFLSEVSPPPCGGGDMDICPEVLRPPRRTPRGKIGPLQVVHDAKDCAKGYAQPCAKPSVDQFG